MTAPAHIAPLVSEAWHPARDVGDIDPLLSDAKLKLRKFSYGKAEGLGITDVDDTYTEGYGRAQAKFKAAVRTLVQAGQRPGPITDTDTEFDWATKKQLGLLAPPAPVDGRKLKPLYITVEGHMSDMWVGPAVEIGRRMEQEDLVQLQPTWYVNNTIPFQSDTGVSSIVGFFLNPGLMPPGRRFCLNGFSEGDIVASRFMLRHVINPAGMFHHRLDDWICWVALGAPYRPLDYIGPPGVQLMPDPPKAGTAGISPERVDPAALGEHAHKLAYLVRHGDMYTETPMDAAGEMQRSIYAIVAASDPSALLMEFLAVGINPTAGILEVAQAIMRGTLFMFDMRPHGGYDIEPAVNWVRGKIRAAVAA